ncbi:MAG: sulfatase [Phycisphaerae bacterium]|nr:sulfatase [Phycisphaerae bacterium]
MALSIALTALVLPEFSVGATRTSDKPNFIVIFIDDQGYQDLGCFGSPNIKTPNIDRMAGEGLRFTDFYSAAQVCTPSRAALLTGCYPERVGNLPVLFPNQRRGLNPQETTIAEMLKGNGYKTACIGKWHLGHLKAFLPTSQGFDSYFGIPYSNDMWLDPNMTLAQDVVLREGVTMDDYRTKRKNSVPLMRNTEVIEYPADQNLLTQRYTSEALAFIEANKANPFFLYLPHTMPHVPLYASPEFEGQSDAGLYGDCIEEIDWSMGEILAALKRLGIDKNTLVVYTSDNGPWDFPNNAKNKVKGNTQRRVGGSALPLRGYKFQTWEGGMREPTVMWWPGHIAAGQECHEIAGTIDLLPTFASLSGSPLPDKTIDGKSLVSLLRNPSSTLSPHDAYFYRTKGVRSGQWKLIDGKLYDLASDIAESTDLSQEHPEVKARLTTLLEERNQEIKQNGRQAGAQ